MNNTKGVNKNITKEETKYIELLCNEKADIILKTEFGTGRYKFVEFKELRGNLMLEFRLLKDSKYHDTKNIYEHIGGCCFLSINIWVRK